MLEPLEPLQPISMPSHAIVVGITSLNSWRSGSPLSPVRLAYVATNSTERLSFVSLQTSSQLARIVRLAARPSLFLDMPYGVVIEIHLSRDLTEGETIQVALAQAGATTYYPPQPIDDSR